MKRRVKSRGVTVLEAALILPVLLSILFGGIEFCYYIYARHVVSTAAREAVRMAAMPDGSTALVTTRVGDVLTPHGWTAAQFTIGTTVNGSTADPQTATAGQTVGVTVSRPWSAFGVNVLGLIPGSKAISAQALARREG
jgi:Flp pilus assembly protein TadG